MDIYNAVPNPESLYTAVTKTVRQMAVRLFCLPTVPLLRRHAARRGRVFHFLSLPLPQPSDSSGP